METKKLIGGKRVRKMALVPVNKMQQLLMSNFDSNKTSETPTATAALYNINAPKPNLNSYYMNNGSSSSMDVISPINNLTETNEKILQQEAFTDPSVRAYNRLLRDLLAVLADVKRSDSEKLSSLLTTIRQHIFYRTKYESGKRTAASLAAALPKQEDELASAVPVRVVNGEAIQQQQQQFKTIKGDEELLPSFPQSALPPQVGDVAANVTFTEGEEANLNQQQQQQQQPQQTRRRSLGLKTSVAKTKPLGADVDLSAPNLKRRALGTSRGSYVKTTLLKDYTGGLKKQAKNVIDQLEIQPDFTWDVISGTPLIKGRRLEQSDIKELLEYEVLRSQGAPAGDEPIGYQAFKSYLQEKDISPRQTSRQTRTGKRSHAVATPVLKYTEIRKKKPSAGREDPLTSTAVRKRRRLDFDLSDDFYDADENNTVLNNNQQQQLQQGSGSQLYRRIFPKAAGILRKWKHY